jgi:hypothetical protein
MGWEKIGTKIELDTQTFTESSIALNEGLVSLWPLDEGSGTTAADIVGDNDGTLTEESWETPGKVGAAALDAGTTTEEKYVVIPDDASLKPGQFSVAVWFNRQGGDETGRRIISKRDLSAQTGYEIALSSTNMVFVNVSDGSANSLTLSEAITDPGWHLVVLVFNGATLSGYFDGGFAGSVAAGVTHNTFDLVIGGRNTGSGLVDFFDGFIDEVGFWNRALTAQEVGVLYNEGNGRAHPYPAPSGPLWTKPEGAFWYKALMWAGGGGGGGGARITSTTNRGGGGGGGGGALLIAEGPASDLDATELVTVGFGGPGGAGATGATGTGGDGLTGGDSSFAGHTAFGGGGGRGARATTTGGGGGGGGGVLDAGASPSDNINGAGGGRPNRGDGATSGNTAGGDSSFGGGGGGRGNTSITNDAGHGGSTYSGGAGGGAGNVSLTGSTVQRGGDSLLGGAGGAGGGGASSSTPGDGGRGGSTVVDGGAQGIGDDSTPTAGGDGAKPDILHGGSGGGGGGGGRSGGGANGGIGGARGGGGGGGGSANDSGDGGDGGTGGRGEVVVFTWRNV